MLGPKRFEEFVQSRKRSSFLPLSLETRLQRQGTLPRANSLQQTEPNSLRPVIYHILRSSDQHEQSQVCRCHKEHWSLFEKGRCVCNEYCCTVPSTSTLFLRFFLARTRVHTHARSATHAHTHTHTHTPHAKNIIDNRQTIGVWIPSRSADIVLFAKSFWALNCFRNASGFANPKSMNE